MPDSLQPSTSNQTECSHSDGNQSNNIDTALDNLDAMKAEVDALDVKVVKDGAKGIQDKMTCQFGKLDAMLNKAENAQYSMQQQNKQIKTLLK